MNPVILSMILFRAAKWIHENLAWIGGYGVFLTLDTKLIKKEYAFSLKTVENIEVRIVHNNAGFQRNRFRQNMGDDMKRVFCLLVILVLGTASSDAARRSAAVLGPMAEKGPDDVPVLIEALTAPAMGTRWNAALLLGEIGDRSAVPALVECVGQDENVRVRRRAIEALGKIGDTSAVPAITAALKSEDNLERRDAARALGALGDTSAVPGLIEALKDEEGFVRRDAALALGLLGDRSAVPALQDLTGEPPEDFSVEAPLGPDEMSPVAREAYFAIGALGGDTAVPAMKAVMKNPVAVVRARAATVMDQLGDDGIPLLAELLEDESADVRRAAAPTLARLGPATADLLVAAARDDTDRDTRRAAVAALKEMGGSEGIAGLLEVLNPDELPGCHLAIADALEALGEIGGTSEVQALRAVEEACRTHHNTYVRRLAVRGRIGEIIGSLENDGEE